MLEKIEGAIRNEQSRELATMYIRHKTKTNKTKPQHNMHWQCIYSSVCFSTAIHMR